MKAKVIETGEIVDVFAYPTIYQEDGQGPDRREWYDDELEIIRPSIKDSKNNIAKELVRYLPYCDDISKDTKERWISWLKTQDDQNPADIKPHCPNGSIPYDRGFEEAQEYLSERGFDIPWNDCDVFVDTRYVTQTIANVLTWADEHPKI